MTGQAQKSQIDPEDFFRADLRIGTVIEALDYPEAKKPAIKLGIDFGPDLGVRWSSAQLTALYTAQDLVGRQVVAVVNFPPRQIGKFMSECLVLGAVGSGPEVVLLQPDRQVPNGWKIA
jgi:tRNA-binding protein